MKRGAQSSPAAPLATLNKIGQRPPASSLSRWLVLRRNFLKKFNTPCQALKETDDGPRNPYPLLAILTPADW
jgi:hypothetical protein